jgi:hypothetical protein
VNTLSGAAGGLGVRTIDHPPPGLATPGLAAPASWGEANATQIAITQAARRTIRAGQAPIGASMSLRTGFSP